MENDNNFNTQNENPSGEELKKDDSYNTACETGYYNHRKEDIIQDDSVSDYKSKQEQKSYYNSTSYTPSAYAYKPKQKKVRNRKKYSAGVVITASVLAAVIGVFGSLFAVGMYIDNYMVTDSSDSALEKIVNITVDETADSIVEAVAQKVSESVVGIRTTTSVVNFFGGSSEATGEGSGVIYSSDGYIVTNYHVISEAVGSSSAKIEVFLESNSSDSYEASVVGYNISTDLAVIKIDAKGLPEVEIGDVDELKVGQYAITIGNPGGLEFMRSVTYGVISGLDRVVSSDSEVGLIQTDAAINPGNSGGALVNTQGQLIGINSSKIVSEEYEGMGFAIPVDVVVDICDGIISKQYSPDPYTGIIVSEKYTAQVLGYYGFPAGAVVLSVTEGSPAESCGIKKGDIITEFNGVNISEYTVYTQVLEQCTPGESVSVVIYRNGNYYTTKIEIGSNN